MTITSSHNQKLKEIRKLRMRRRERDRAGRFVAEGEDLLEAADAAGWEAIERFCAAGSGLPGVEVEPRLLASASELGSGTRTLGVYEERWAPTPSGPLCVYLHGVHDPGNVGAVLRSAEAFGASCVAIGPMRRSVRPQGGPREHGRGVCRPALARRRRRWLGRLPGTKIALVAATGRPGRGWTARGRASVTLLIGAEREGLPAS